MSASAFDPRSLTRQYAFLDACPESLFGEVVTLPVGSLEERMLGVRRWHDALLAGALPDCAPWPGEPVGEPIRRALASLSLPRFCRGDEPLTDAVMWDVLAAIRTSSASFADAVQERLDELETLERKKLDADAPIDPATLARLREQAGREAAGREPVPDADLTSAWSGLVRLWSAVSDVFGDLGNLLGRGWDLSRGVLKHTGWKDLVRLQQLVAQVPQLREIVQALGRLQDSDQEQSVAEQIFRPITRLEEERREVRTPLIPAEVRGVERSGEIARMLPVEASMLGHPKLRMLWHARRVERALMTYRVEGTEIEKFLVEREGVEEAEGARPRPDRGPILAVIDTSGSMQGVPEQVAKALILEAVRTAHAEKRRCFLFAWSGPGDILERELHVGPGGIGEILDFLGFSFHGGNDLAAMTKVVERLSVEAWRKADVLFVSDGEWSVSAPIVAAVARAKSEGTRFHGVQIGSRGHTSMHQICEPVHDFRDWAAAGGWR